GAQNNSAPSAEETGKTNVVIGDRVVDDDGVLEYVPAVSTPGYTLSIAPLSNDTSSRDSFMISCSGTNYADYIDAQTKAQSSVPSPLPVKRAATEGAVAAPINRIKGAEESRPMTLNYAFSAEPSSYDS